MLRDRISLPYVRTDTSVNRVVRPLAVLLAICCCLSAASGQRPETTTEPVAASRPGFDPQDVVRQVRSGRSTAEPPDHLTTNLDDDEFLIDTSITYVRSPSSHENPAIAFDGANFLVVWEDGRGHDIYGARVTPAGVVLDPAGIAISTATGMQSVPAPVFDGVDFLVVWQDGRSGHAIYGTRVTSAGAVLDPAGIAISTGTSNNGFDPVLAYDGENVLVVWHDYGSASDIYGARVTPAGEVLDPSGIIISAAANSQSYPALAFDGENTLVVWQDGRSGSDVYGARVTPAGEVLDTSGFAISTGTNSGYFPALDFDGEDFLVVWQDNSRGSDVYGTRVTPAGVVLDPAGIAVSTAANDKRNPRVAFDGENSLVVWFSYGSVEDIHGTRVTPAGVVLDPAGFVISQAASNQWVPALAFDGENSLVVWTDERNSALGDIYGTRVTPTGVVIDSSGIGISAATNSQSYPALAFGGENFFVVWQDSRSGSSDIYGTRVTPAGVVLDTAGVAISTATGDQSYPAIAFDGENFFVVWQDSRSGSSDIYGARVTPTGVVLDTAGVAISTATNDQSYPALAFDGENFLVAWADYRISSSWDIYGARVSRDGIVLDPTDIAISTATGTQSHPVLACDGENCLVVWADRRSGSSDIYGARMTPTGAVLDTAGIAISTAADNQYFPALAFNSQDFLVVWEDKRDGSFSEIYGALVTSSGWVRDTLGIAIHGVNAATSHWSPAVAFDGENCLVVWQDSRSGTSYDIYGARVSFVGSAFDLSPLVTQEGDQRYPALASGPDNQMFLVYQGWTGMVGGETYNTDRIWGTMNLNLAMAEMTKPEVRMTNNGATIVRGVLNFGAVSGQRAGYRAELLDIRGRKVLDLHPGANDVRALAPGVYFVRAEPQAASRKPQAVRKVVVTR